MPRKFLAPVWRDAEHRLLAQGFNHRRIHAVRRLLLQPNAPQIAAFAVNQRQQHRTTHHACNGISFPVAHNAVREAAYARIDRVMAFLDNLIGERGHVYRGKRSVADAYAYVMARWSVKTPKPYSAYPHLAAFMTRMGEDEAVKRVLAASNA